MLPENQFNYEHISVKMQPLNRLNLPWKQQHIFTWNRNSPFLNYSHKLRFSKI